MENKGKISMSLGTAICIFIIVLLIIALVGVICYNSNKGKNEITNNPYNYCTSPFTMVKISPP